MCTNYKGAIALALFVEIHRPVGVLIKGFIWFKVKFWNETINIQNIIK
jgi:hypothetical protein